MNRKIIATGAAVAIFAIGCGSTSVYNEQAAVDAQQQQYAKVQPVPYFDYSTQRGLLIDIYKSQNENHQTWAVVTSYSGQLVFECESQGYPIPASYQLTNSLRNVGTGGPVAEAEPNGLFSGATSGTYVMCIRDNGQVSPIYTENNVQMFPFRVTVDANGTIHDAGGDSTITVAPQYSSATSAPSTKP